MNEREITSVDLIEGGNVIKQGHYLTLGFIPRDVDGDTVDLTGKNIAVALYNHKQIIYETTATFSGGVLRFTIDEIIESGNAQVEFTATSSTDAGYRQKFPTNKNDGRLSINRSSDDLDFYGVPFTTVSQFRAEFDQAINALPVDGEINLARVGTDGTVHNSLPARLEAEQEVVVDRIADIATVTKRTVPGLDMTAILQGVFNLMPDGSTIRIPAGVYEVEKNMALSGFPKNDQPCLAIMGKKNIRIIADGVTLKTDVHAQGVLEIQLSDNILIEGLKVEGLGVFPDLDGTTGRGEKGTTTEGYYTTGYWGYHKNNSMNTSASTTGGNVPKPWGMFNGGYIGNAAHGVLVQNGCKNITFRNCEASGFNYAGFGVGHFGDDGTYPDSENVVYENCYGHDNYQSNFFCSAANGYKVLGGSLSERAGHPDAAPLTDTFVDPGYGVMLTGNGQSMAKVGTVKDIIVKDCVRKGIDVHAGSDLVIKDNYVDNCYVAGIYAAWSSPTQHARDIVIADNTVKRSGIRGLAGIYYQGSIDATYSLDNIKANVNIDRNKLIDCSGGTAILHARTFDVLSANENTVDGVDERETRNTLVGIYAGKGANRSYSLAVKDNFVLDKTGKMYIGIYAENVENGSVNDNIVKIANAVQGIGIYSVTNGDVAFLNNTAKIGTLGTPLAISQTTGHVSGNTGTGGNAANAIAKNKKSVASFDSVSANALNATSFATLESVSIADDTFYTLSGVKAHFIGLLNDDAGRWVLFNSNNANGITEILKANFNVVTNTTPTGTTGVDGFPSVFKQNGNIYIENRSGATRKYSLTILG